jgi:hypothetical protein
VPVESKGRLETGSVEFALAGDPFNAERWRGGEGHFPIGLCLYPLIILPRLGSH